MNWTEEERRALYLVLVEDVPDSAVAIANKAAELLAARGGTMMAEDVALHLETTSRMTPQATMRIREHIAALGARIATLEAEHGNPESLRAHNARLIDERDAALKRAENLAVQRDAETRRADSNEQRAEHAETRVRELAIAGQRLSAAVDKHVGEPHEPVKVHAQGVLLLTESGVIPMGHYPCSPTCTHDDAATPGHPERVKERSEAFNDMRLPDIQLRCVVCAKETPHRWRPSVEAGPFWRCSECSEPFKPEIVDTEAYRDGAEAMRAACLEAAEAEGEELGLGPHVMQCLKAAVEGAAP